MNLQENTELGLNLISDTVKKYLEGRPLLPGQPARYRLLCGVTNTDPARKKGYEILYPSSIGFTLKDRLNDPGLKHIVQIGVVSGFDDKGQPKYRYFTHNPMPGTKGEFSLRAESLDELEMYDFIELSNKNKSNPWRDQSVKPLFERIDEEKESEVRSTKRNYLFDSFTAIRTWNRSELRWVAAAYNIDPKASASVMKDRLETIAEADPKGFYETIDSEDLKIKAIIKIAKSEGVISFNAHENRWTYTVSGETIALLPRREGVDEIEQLKEFLKSSANGPAIKDNIVHLISPKSTKKDKNE